MSATEQHNHPRVRGSGHTTAQMAAAPFGATFVWCNGDLSYPRGLAKALGREDLVLQPIGWLRERNVRGRRDLVVVLDHAAEPDQQGRETMQYLYVLDAQTARGSK